MTVGPLEAEIAMAPTRIGILVFPRVQQLDLTGPFEVFASLPETEVRLVGKVRGPVTTVTGLTLVADTTLDDCPRLDVLCVPGGSGINALLEDDAVLDFVRRQAAGVRYLTSVCTGALVLGAAGLLAGRRATTHWGSHGLLQRFGAIPVEARVVRDGDLFTGGGVTAGIDMALTVVAELAGEAAAQAIQLYLEYAPAPPFAAGHPETAPPEVVDAVRRLAAANIAERDAILARLGR